MTDTPKDPDILSDPQAQAWRRGELTGGPTMTPQPMTQDAPQIVVRPCFDATGKHRTSWDICYRPEPGDKGVGVIASCYGPREQAERMADALRKQPTMPVLMSQEWLDQKVASDPDSECEVRSTSASPAGEVGEMIERDARVALIDAIIADYHTTRMRETPAAQHILTKGRSKEAFARFEAHIRSTSPDPCNHDYVDKGSTGCPSYECRHCGIDPRDQYDQPAGPDGEVGEMVEQLRNEAVLIAPLGSTSRRSTWEAACDEVFAERLAASDTEAMRPMETAPKDGTPVLVRFVASVFPGLRPERPDLEGWNGLYAVMRSYDNISGWSYAGPLGMGGFTDEFFEGWRPLAKGGAT